MRRRAGRLATASVALAAALAITWPAPARAAPAEAVRFAPERDYGPFVYVDENGRVAGLSIDLLERIRRVAGFELRMLPAQPLAAQLELARRGRVDLLSSLRPTPERAEYLLFSQPYASVPAIVVVRSGTARRGSGFEHPLGRLDGLAVAVGAGYAVESVVRAKHPGVRWQSVRDDTEALLGVARGTFEAAVVDAASATFVRRRLGLTGLESLGEVGFHYQLSFAVPRTRPDLLSRIDAALATLPQAQRRELLRRWIDPMQGPTTTRRHEATRLGALLVALAAAIAAVRVLSRRMPLQPRRREPA